MSNRDHIEKLKAAADSDQVAAALGLRSGPGNRFFCPACQPAGGKTPDLSFGNKGFHCFKCGLKGDLLKLVQVAGGMDFPAAVAWMENLTGIAPERAAGEGRKKAYRRAGPGEKVEPRADRTAKPANLPPVDSTVLEMLLDSCRTIDGEVFDWLTEIKGVAPEVIKSCRLRYCGAEYPDIMEDLEKIYGKDRLLASGLLKPGNDGRPVPTFWHYWAKKAGFLVIPYIQDDRPVFLKVRPPVQKATAERLGLVRFMNIAGPIPCLYNVDVLKEKPKPKLVLVCEGESDTWTALTYGFPAVGTPGAGGFKAEWVENFRPFANLAGRSTVYLATDPDLAGENGARTVAGLFRDAGLPVPLKLDIPAGMDLNRYMIEGITTEGRKEKGAL